MLEKITSTDAKEFKDAWKIYEKSFPKDSGRSLEKQKEIMIRSEYTFYVYREGEIKAFIAVWDLGDFCCIEHFAVHEMYRNVGIGSKILRECMSICNKRIILEVEPPKTEKARKRVHFYERFGFVLNPFRYVQPPYAENKNPLPLALMSRPAKLDLQQFENARGTMHRVMYGFAKPILECPEMMDVVDETDLVIATVSRDVIRQKNLLHRGVAVIVERTDGTIVAHQRSAKKKTFPKHWDIAFGGGVQASESYEDAAKRELEEELGIRAPLQFAGKLRVNLENSQFFCAVYICWSDGPYHPLPDEVIKIQYVSRQDVNHLPQLVPDALLYVQCASSFLK
jgi:isopentenyldiphosphate isomerase/ribosomal protein S18 acetylase RimI-like enzyme